eukprot:EG_transcript_34713
MQFARCGVIQNSNSFFHTNCPSFKQAILHVMCEADCLSAGLTVLEYGETGPACQQRAFDPLPNPDLVCIGHDRLVPRPSKSPGVASHLPFFGRRRWHRQRCPAPHAQHRRAATPQLGCFSLRS